MAECRRFEHSSREDAKRRHQFASSWDLVSTPSSPCMSPQSPSHAHSEANVIFEQPIAIARAPLPNDPQHMPQQNPRSKVPTMQLGDDEMHPKADGGEASGTLIM